MTDALIVTIDGEGVIHEFEEMGRHDKVVFKDDDAAVLPDTLRHAVDDAGGQPQVVVALDDRDAPEAADPAHVTAHLLDGSRIGLAAGGVRVDVEGAPSGKDAAAERLDTVARMLRPVVDKEQDGGKGQCFHPRFMLRVERTSLMRCGHP
ncbi:unknown [Prevotella sp. CAG:755]|nr:unknown [Prevotella sp. CAG:755]